MCWGSMGGYHSCAIQSGAAAIVCWGNGGYGETTAPASVNGTSGTASAIAAGADYTCAVQEGTGAVVCWGADCVSQSIPPPSVDGSSGSAIAIAAGNSGNHTCAIQAGSYAVVCWGNSLGGQLDVPAALDPVHGREAAISVGGSNTLAIRSPECSDGLDNDGDGKIDLDGGAAANHGVALGSPDPQCTTPNPRRGSEQPAGSAWSSCRCCPPSRRCAHGACGATAPERRSCLRRQGAEGRKTVAACATNTSAVCTGGPWLEPPEPAFEPPGGCAQRAMPRSDPLAWILWALIGLGLVWLACELAMRWWIARPLATGFYGSLRREEVRAHQERHGVRVACGPGWVHLGWIADPEREGYVVEHHEPGAGEARGGWREFGRTRLGSFLVEGHGGELRVRALPRVPRSDEGGRVVGVVTVEPEPGPEPPVLRPEIAGPWRPLFRPRAHGRYVNDHTIFRDAHGRWRLLGITSQSDGDFAAERWLAAASSDAFPPPAPETMTEEAHVADFGELAWAPHVVSDANCWHLFWSPHRLYQMSSTDGVRWQDPVVTLDPPRHRFFRDTMVLEVAPGQWLLYATARGRYYSRVDCYQSFDLEHWQYIGPALRTGFGCERASPFASTESPTVVRHEGRYYLALTYNNDSFFWPGLLLLVRRWPGRDSYNDTRVFHSANPYDFGCYRGPRHASSEVARLSAHAAELIRHPETGSWWITTAGWPWVATLTSGEVAVAPLRWCETLDLETSTRPPGTTVA